MAVIHITKSNFAEEVLHSEIPVILDFWAEWCGPCKMMAPAFHEASEEVENVKFGKVDIMAEGELAERFGIMSIPTLMVFEHGKEQNTVVGLQSKETIKKMVGA